MNPRNPCFVLAAALLLAGTAPVSGCAESKKAPPAPSPPVVYVMTIARRDVSLYIEAIGALDGYDNADIRARARGYLRSQDYKDGAHVQAGQRLFTIEATEYAVAVSSAKASVARARVAQERNRGQLERDQGLFKTGMISQQDLDNVAATVADANGQVMSAQAQLQQAELNLSYTEIRSPLSGVAGLALVRIGNLVGQDGPTLLTTVSQVDPIRVNFPISEVDYVRYPERFKHLDGRDLVWAKTQFAKLDSGATADNGDAGVEIILSDGSVYPHRGVIVAANRQIDPSTGTIQLQVLVPNPDASLRPGQYGRVRIKRQEIGHNALAVPEKALIPVQGTYSVGVIDQDNKVTLRRVEVGPSVQGLRVIEKGLADGERIVVEGVQKISDGAVVDPRPVPAPTPAPVGATVGKN